MNISDIIQKTMKNFLMIFASIIILLTILRQIYYPHMDFDLQSIYTIMAFSLISALTGFILYSPHDLSEKGMRMRMVIQFLTLEILLIALASVLDIVNSVSDGIILALEILAILTFVRLLSWRNDKKEAQIINDKLKEFKNDMSIKS